MQNLNLILELVTSIAKVWHKITSRPRNGIAMLLIKIWLVLNTISASVIVMVKACLKI